MAAISVGSNNSSNPGATGSNMYRVGDYVYFEAPQQQSTNQQQQQPFQIRRIEELNKTAGGNVEAKVMCFYRRRDLPAQLIALADKHHQQQLALTLSLSASSSLKSGGKQTSTVKTTEKGSVADSKEQDTNTTVMKKSMEEDQIDSHAEVSGILKEEQRFDGVGTEESVENNISASNTIKSGDGNDSNMNNETSDTSKDEDKTVQAALQQQNDWWRSEQLKQRELFLSRQVETMAATHIRGKCTVTLYNETESLDSYLEKDDTFFYCLVFDPVQKTLLADKGEIRVGHKYQAEVPPKAQYSCNDLKTKDIKNEIVKKECLIDGGEVPMLTDCIRDEDNKVCVTKSSTITTVATSVTLESDSDLETLVWTCRPQWNHLSDRQIDQFLVVSRSLGTFARALDCTSSVKQPSLHMSAAAASRDITLFHAMDTLHRHGYDLGSATCSLVPSTGPVLCRDEMEEWSASEANLFEEALEKYGKDFGDIRHDFLPWKTHKNIVEYYYMWKTTDRYVQQKRVKAVEQESKLKQVYIPSYNSTNSGKQPAITSKSSHQLLNGNSSIELYSPKHNSGSDGQLLSGACDLCDAVVSQQWFPNTIGVTSGQTPLSYHQQNGGSSIAASSTLCFDCWNHWKKYGGPRTASTDKKVITAVRGESISGDEDRPPSNASSSSTAINMNARSSSHAPSMMNAPHHQQLMNVSGHHNSYQQQQPSASSTTGSGSHLLHQPHINSSSLSTSNHKCTIIGCMSAPFKSKSQLLRHYNSTHGIGINSNNTSSSSTILSLANNKCSNVDGGVNDMVIPQSQLQQVASNVGHYNNTGGPLNLNSSNTSVQLSNSTGGSVNQVINYVASSSPQPQPNNLSMSGIASNNALGSGVALTASGRPVMKTRTAFYLRSTSLVKASRRRAAQQAAIALYQQQQQKKKSSGSLAPTPSLLQPGCLARPRNVARRPFICVPQTAHTYKHECMLSMQHAPVHELRAYLRAAAAKAHARRPGVTRVANALIAARRGRSGNSAAIAADLAVPDWLFLPSQQQHQVSHHHVSSSKHGKQSSRSSNGGRVAFPKPPKAPDGSLLYERVPNKQEAQAVTSGTTNVLNNTSAVSPTTAVGLNPVTAAAILGALGPPGSANNTNTNISGSSNDPTASGFDVPAAVLYQSASSSSSNKRRLFETESGGSARKQPQPQVGPPSKRMHRQHHSQQLQSAPGHHQTQLQQPMSLPTQAAGGAVDGMLASIVAHQQQQQQRGNLGGSGPLQLTTSGSNNKSSGMAGHQQMQQHNHYRTPSMARTGRKHVISWTDAPDDLYYRCTTLSRSLRKARMTGRELRRSARKPWQPIAALLGISFAMPPNNTVTSSVTSQVAGMSVVQNAQQPGVSVTPSSAEVGAPYDMTTSNNRKSPSALQPNQSSAVPCSGAPVISSCSGSGVSSHH